MVFGIMQKEFLQTFLKCGTIVAAPGKNVFIGWGNRTFFSSLPEENTPLFYFNDFYLEKKTPWYTHEHTAMISMESLAHEIHAKSIPYQTKWHWNLEDSKRFHTIFSDLQNRFASRELEKGVPCIFTEAQGELKPEGLMHCLESILHTSQRHPLLPYGMWEDGEGILGATPELLFHYERGVFGEEGDTPLVKTMACAGTCANKEDELQFLAGEKNQKEHQLVVDGIEEALRPFGSVERGDRKLLPLATLAHLSTEIILHPKEKLEFEKLVSLLHPTPALGAYPLTKGIEWLKKFYTGDERGHFGAPCGYLRNKQQDAFCLVGIRNMEWNRERIRIGAGCGVVKESNEGEEWKELQLKIQTVKKMLSL